MPGEIVPETVCWQAEKVSP